MGTQHCSLISNLITPFCLHLHQHSNCATMPSSHPDADLHPVATGPAKAIVDAHQAEQPLKLYAGWLYVHSSLQPPNSPTPPKPPTLLTRPPLHPSCPFVQRVWSILEEKQIPYQYIEVNPYHKPDSLLSLNPRGLVPTLQYEGKPLFESTVIGEFLEEAFPEHGPKLMPQDVYLRARTRCVVPYFPSPTMFTLERRRTDAGWGLGSGPTSAQAESSPRSIDTCNSNP